MRVPLRSIVLKTGYFAGALVIFLTGVVLSRGYDLEFQIRKIGSRADTTVYTPDHTRRSGEQLVMVYFGSASCAWSNQPSLPDAVETIKRSLAVRAEEQGMTFKAVGVALDWSPEQGIAHLEKMGRFDEISAGYNWGNTLALQHIWSDAFAAPTTPQILVYTRVFVAPEGEGSPLQYEATLKEVVITKSGLDAIQEWVDAEVRL